MAPASDELPPGTRLAGHYVVREKLGYGGMAQIYRAQHDQTGKYVAIKVLGRELISEKKVVKRFLREARTSSKVRHDHIVELLDLGETRDGRPFLVMELLEGEDLGFTLRRMGSLSWERAKPMLLQVLGALEAAHAEGVIHRDVKPENIFRITRDGTDDYLKVFDFGIAKVLKEPGEGKPLTLEGQVMGTPAYMSPEQCAGERVDARSDLYSVGILAFEKQHLGDDQVGQRVIDRLTESCGTEIEGSDTDTYGIVDLV